MGLDPRSGFEVEAFAESWTQLRDINWISLQASNEYGARIYHSSVIIRKAKALEPIETVLKFSHESYEEAGHYQDYMKILNWYLEGNTCEDFKMWGSGDISDGFGPGAGMTNRFGGSTMSIFH